MQDYSMFQPLDFSKKGMSLDFTKPIADQYANYGSGGYLSNPTQPGGAPVPAAPAPAAAAPTSEPGEPARAPSASVPNQADMFQDPEGEGDAANNGEPAGLFADSGPKPAAVFQPNVTPDAELPAPDQSRLGKIHDAIQGLFVGKQPVSYGATADEIARAKPTLMQALRDPSGGGELWQKNLDNLLAHKGAAALAQRAQEVQVQRNKLFAENPPPVNGTPAQKQAWAQAMQPGLLRIGDYDGVKELAAYGKAPTLPAGTYFKNDATGEVRSFSKGEGTSIPAGWSQMKTPSNSPPRLWIDPKTNKYYSMDDIDPTTASKMGLRSEEDYRAQFNQENYNERFGVTNAKSIGEDFNKSPIVTQLAKQAESYGGFKATLAEARNANPSAYKALISQMAPTVDPGVTLRLGMLQFINKLDPSLMGEMKTAYQRMVNGSYPKEQLDNLEKLVDRITTAHAAYYDSLREDLLKGTPGAAVHVRPTSVLYPGVDFSGTTPTGGAKKTGKLDINQWLRDNPPGGKK